MKKITLGLMTLLFALAFSSCQKAYYQVCTTKASVPSVFTTQTDRYVYEDENVIIVYNLWKADGDRGFVIYNKTDSYLHLDSYESCATTTVVGKEGEWTIGDFGSQHVVAPHTNAVFDCKFSILKEAILVEGLKEKVRHSESMSFNINNTPLQFANHINYYYYKPDNSKVDKTIVHSFYVDQVTNYKRKDYQKMVKKYTVKTDILSNGKVYKGKGLPKEMPVNRKGFFNIYYK